MRKLLALLLTACLLLVTVSASADIFDTLNDVMNTLTDGSSTTETPAQPAAPARGSELAFVDENITYTTYGDSYVSGYYSAEIYNGSSEDVTFASYGNRANIYNAADDSLVKEDVYISIYPETIAPGESAYINQSFSLAVGSDVPSINTKVYFKWEISTSADDSSITKKYPEPRMTVTDLNITRIKEYSWSSDLTDGLECVITNNTGNDVRGLDIHYALYDQNGKLIYADKTYLDNKFVLRNGDHINLSMTFWSWVNDYCSSNGLDVASATVLVTPY